jgi:hypothetical protein
VLPWLLGALGDQIVGDHLRVVILEWNIRSLKAYRRVGFRDVGTHSNAADTYLLLTRPRPEAVPPAKLRPTPAWRNW